jgi:hydrogenase maturation protease
MTESLVEKIADAVLYEGYILYPYRPSAVKNQQRWNFGALCPESYSVAQRGTESWTMQTECLIQANLKTSLSVKVRFLHLLMREVAVPNSSFRSGISDSRFPIPDGAEYQVVPSLEVNGRLQQTWQEAVEREVVVPSVKLNDSENGSRRVSSIGSRRVSFSFPGSESSEDLRDAGSGELLGVIIRKQQALAGAIEVRVTDCGFSGEIQNLEIQKAEIQNADQSNLDTAKADRLLKVTIQILNETPLENAPERSRDDALMRSFVSTHTILNADGGEFVSLLDPPEAFREAAAACSNLGTYPVLVGEEGARDCMLSSPIILYDYPQIAPESPGSLFDGTEIDEILTLRIMTLTDEEKREMRGADERARQILERTELLPAEQLMKMHGAMKGVNRKS